MTQTMNRRPDEALRVLDRLRQDQRERLDRRLGRSEADDTALATDFVPDDAATQDASAQDDVALLFNP